MSSISIKFPNVWSRQSHVSRPDVMTIEDLLSSLPPDWGDSFSDDSVPEVSIEPKWVDLTQHKPGCLEGILNIFKKHKVSQAPGE